MLNQGFRRPEPLPEKVLKGFSQKPEPGATLIGKKGGPSENREA